MPRLTNVGLGGSAFVNTKNATVIGGTLFVILSLADIGALRALLR